MKRQRGRGRGGGGGKPQQNANRAFDSNGPDGVKVRGNAQHVFEKYQQLARDAASSGDRVLAENYLQHAEHYFRLLRAIQPQRPASEILGRDQFASGFDIDFEEEPQAQPQPEAVEETTDTAEEGDGRERGGWQGRERDRRDRWRDREDRRDRDDRPRDERRDDRFREDRPRDERPREDRPRDDRPREDRRDRFERQERGERAERDPLAVVEPRGSAPLGGHEEPASPVLRDAEGGQSHAPAFLQSPARREEDEQFGGRRRRRRGPRSFEQDEGGSAQSNEPEEA